MKIHKLEKPQKTFFFERPNGQVFSVKESEAWELLKGRGQVIGAERVRNKIIGVSDGKIFYQAVMEAHELSKTDPQAALERLRQGERDELAAARNNIEMPQDMDKFGEGKALI